MRMEPSTPATAGKPKTGDVEALTYAKAKTLAQAWISAKNRIAHFTPEPSGDDDVQRGILSRGGPSLGDVFSALFGVFEPWVRHRGMVNAARELGISRKHTKVLLQRFQEAWSSTQTMTYADQVDAIARVLLEA